MSTELSGGTVAFLVAAEGIEQVELTEPWQAVQQAGGRPVLLSPEPGHVQAFDHLDKADTFPVDVALSDAPDASAYDALVLPGGVANPGHISGRGGRGRPRGRRGAGHQPQPRRPAGVHQGDGGGLLGLRVG